MVSPTPTRPYSGRWSNLMAPLIPHQAIPDSCRPLCSRAIFCSNLFEGHPWATAPADVFHLPKPPTFATTEEERRHRKQRLAAAFRIFSSFGFDEGVAGHITARDPERLDHFWVNPFGMHFGQIRVSDLILVNHRGEVVEGKHPVNVAAFAIHSQVHSARPEKWEKALGSETVLHSLVTRRGTAVL